MVIVFNVKVRDEPAIRAGLSATEVRSSYAPDKISSQNSTVSVDRDGLLCDFCGSALGSNLTALCKRVKVSWHGAVRESLAPDVKDLAARRYVILAAFDL